jgi:hypothetical protein
MHHVLELAADSLAIAVPLVPVGFFLKWAVAPCVIAFGAGLHVGKIVGRKQAGRHARTTAPAR